ncbi:SDR family NAD(P)-dependent oxidoreductase [Streptomyces albipurpureus]|uniref:SDR family NAD(P)-dependent oxidoreductase n=1 Tax=Streptomyces albipurpureus TaxID=2897419 RepID=A0ABT0UMZ2_9ACTN|nr:SDR family NAD(P)-dependent oxidoreductase [Streptomyces sp. CWNU-1]MCM2389450.1 SDR family NAD(P)-dependent oxidoreductase [Streptomyces sp. CWNU-1]
MMELTGRVAVVTGAGRGLGRAHALLLASLGAAVVVNDLGGGLDGSGGSAETAESVVAEITLAGGIAVANADSVATSAGGAEIVGTALREFGRVDIVVNNAGTTGGLVGFGDLDDERLMSVLGSHLIGCFNVSRAAWGPMVAQGYGRIVNTTSGVGLFGMGKGVAYAAAKMGIVGLTRSLAVEGEVSGIKVNAIAPIAATRMAGTVFGALDEHLDPARVSPVVAYLAHADCPVTGRVISVGGGRVGEVFLGAARGYFNADLTPDDVRENFDTALDHTDFVLPLDAMDEVGITATMHGLSGI